VKYNAILLYTAVADLGYNETYYQNQTF